MPAPKVFSDAELALIKRVKGGEDATKVAAEVGMKASTLRQWVNKDKPKATKVSSSNKLAELKAIKSLKLAAEADANCPAALRGYLTDYFNDFIDGL